MGAIISTFTNSTNEIPTVTINNCVIWNNSNNQGVGSKDGSIQLFGNSTLTVNNSLVQGWAPTDFPNGSNNFDGTDPANAPQFVQAVPPTSAPTSAGDYRLQATSPLINGGNNAFNTATTDLDGNPRIVNTTIDLGAYELQGALPVELLTFAGRRVNKQTQLTWATATERQNEGFALLHSPDGKAWTEFAFEAGRGDSDRKVQYAHTVQQAAHQFGYFKLKQLDYDGGYSYSEVVYVAEESGSAVAVYPNPVRTALTVTGMEAGAPYVLRDTYGRVVRRGVLNGRALATGDLVSGITGVRLS